LGGEKKYIGGTYLDSGKLKPCYWVNGKRVELSAPSGADYTVVSAIAVYEGKVYAAGYYQTVADIDRPCYWVGGVLHDNFAIPTDVKEMGVNSSIIHNGNVYAVGEYEKNDSSEGFCYWKNETKVDDSGTWEFGRFCVSGDDIYLFVVDNSNVVAYFKNEVSKSFSSTISYNGDHSSFAVYNDEIYIMENHEAHYSRYSMDGALVSGSKINLDTFDVMDPSDRLNVSSMALNNGAVYSCGNKKEQFAGDSSRALSTGCYWINETKYDLAGQDDLVGREQYAPTAISVFNGKIYITGAKVDASDAENEWGYPNTWKACYWVDNVKYYLNDEKPAAATCVFLTE
jgi:hypothetical protein